MYACVQDEEMEAEEEDDEITQEPESIICHDLRGKVPLKACADITTAPGDMQVTFDKPSQHTV